MASYGKILSKRFLSIPKYGALNVHPSLLPKYRGSSPIPNAILNGDKETGITIIKMTDKVDFGPILSQSRLMISPSDTTATLYEQLALRG